MRWFGRFLPAGNDIQNKLFVQKRPLKVMELKRFIDFKNTVLTQYMMLCYSTIAIKGSSQRTAPGRKA